MGVTIAIQISSPVEDSDKDLVSALSMLLFALGGGTVPQQEAEDEEVPVEPPPESAWPPAAPPICGLQHDDGRVCVSAPLHRGRHLFRYIAPGMN